MPQPWPISPTRGVPNTQLVIAHLDPLNLECHNLGQFRQREVCRTRSSSLPISTSSTLNATILANFANVRCAEQAALVPHLDRQILEHDEIGEIGWV